MIKARGVTNHKWWWYQFCFDFNHKKFLCIIALINPVNPKIDWRLISPSNIIPESHIKVTRI